MSEILDYDKSLVETLRHIENMMLKFSLQNYAASGATFLAYYNDKISREIAVLTVIVLVAIYTLAICSNIKRYRVLAKVHRITLNRWFIGQPELRDALRDDADCKVFLAIKKLSLWTFVPMIIISVLPAVAALGIFLRQ